ATPALKPSRARLPATGARPLRPGPRVPLSQLTQRGRTSTTTTQAPLESEEIEKEVSSAEEQHAPQVVEEVRIRILSM
ncbi:hypothetical protein, partial [Staphylococcus aureus]|uniref:hypothetical protein n=1 Tax=Staphylococcus aureus TaxID=1280 RepID=UPI003A80FB5E